MNRRLASKRALLATGKFPRPIEAIGLFESTGSIALAIGFWRPKVLIDPRAYGEHRVLRQYVLWHESAHVLLSHTRILEALRWFGIVMMAGLFAILGAFSGSVYVTIAAMLVGGWIEARFGAWTVWYRAQAEIEADALALSVMLPEHFAAAVKTMATLDPPRKGLDGYIDRRVYGATFHDRLARQGIAVKA